MGKKARKAGQSEIVFDRSKRIEFCTGFKRRKDQRREKAKAKLKEDEKEKKRENREARVKQRQLVEEQYEQIRAIM